MKLVLKKSQIKDGQKGLQEEDGSTDPNLVKDIEDLTAGDVSAAKSTAKEAEKVADTTNAEIIVDPDDIDESEEAVQVLDRALYRAKKVINNRLKYGNSNNAFMNVELIGDSGSGKSTVVRKWAISRGINLIKKNAKSFDMTDFKGKAVDRNDPNDWKYTAVRSDEWDVFNDQNNPSVLFLDEFNRAKKDIRGTLLTLISEHEVEDKTQKPSESRFLPGLLFTIIAINPHTSAYSGTDESEGAEKDRTRKVFMASGKSNFIKHFKKQVERELSISDSDAEKQNLAYAVQVAEKLMMDRAFHFTTPEEREELVGTEFAATDYRTLEAALLDATVPTDFKRGKEARFDTIDEYIERFCEEYQYTCDPNTLDIVKAALSNFKVNDDSMNRLLNAHKTQDKIFNKK